MGQSFLPEGAAPATPAAGYVSVYAKADDLIYGKDDAGLETKMSNTLTAGTPIATTSGTAHDFTGLPSWVKKITVILNSTSTSGLSPYIIQLGDSGGIETTAYNSISNVVFAGTPAILTSTTGLLFTYDSVAARNVIGIMEIINVSGNIWVSSFNSTQETFALTNSGTGSKTLSATLDRIRLTTVGGTDTFDAGSVNILYE